MTLPDSDNHHTVSPTTLDALASIVDKERQWSATAGIKLANGTATATDGAILLQVGSTISDDDCPEPIILQGSDCKGAKSLALKGANVTVRPDPDSETRTILSGCKGTKTVGNIEATYPDVKAILHDRDSADKVFYLDLVKLKQLIDATLKVADKDINGRVIAKFSFKQSDPNSDGVCCLSPLYLSLTSPTIAGCIMPCKGV